MSVSPPAAVAPVRAAVLRRCGALSCARVASLCLLQVRFDLLVAAPDPGPRQAITRRMARGLSGLWLRADGSRGAAVQPALHLAPSFFRARGETHKRELS